MLEELEERPLNDVGFDGDHVALARLDVVLHDHILAEVLIVITLRQTANCVAGVRGVERVHSDGLFFSKY